MTDREAINALRLEGGLEINGTATRLAEFMMGLHIAISALQEREERSKVVVPENVGWDEAWCEWGKCPICGENNYWGAKFCNECGRPLKTAMPGEEQHK